MFSSMAKKSYKQRCKSEKVQVGCVSGLIRMFDFRRNPKLLSDGSHGISRYSVRSDLKGYEDLYGIISADNDKDRQVKTIYAGRPSIKSLMEEEMASGTQPLKQTQRSIFGVCSDDLKSVNLPEGSDIDLNLAASLMEIYRNHNEGREISNTVESGHASNSIDEDNNIDAGVHLNRIPSSIQKALEDVAEAVISHQSTNAKYITSSGEARSKEFVDALQLLSSNKGLFLMLLQDPSSRLLQCLQNLYTSLGSPKLELTESDEETKLQGMTNSLGQPDISPCKVQRRHNSSLKKDKLVMRKAPKLNESSRGLSRIVILKPTPSRSQSGLISSSATSSPLSNHTNLQGQEDNDNPAHHLSLRELRRRLRLAISDNRKDTIGSTFQKAHSTKQFPVESMSTSSASTDSSDCERAEQPSIVDKETNPKDSGSGIGNDATHGVSSFSYEKAKQHLMERLYNQGDDSSQIVHKSESIGGLISYPECDTISPSHCPQEVDVTLLQEATYSSLIQTIEQEDSSANSNPPKQETVQSDNCALVNKQLDEHRTDYGNHTSGEGTFSQELITFSQELITEGVKNMQDAVDNLPLCAEIENSSESLEHKKSGHCSLEETQSMNALSEVPLHSPEDLVSEQDNHNPSAVVELAKPSILTFPCSPDNADEKEEKLSPQSILVSFLGDSTNPTHKSRKQDELPMPSSRILFKELDTPSASPTVRNRRQVDILDDKDARVSFIKVVLEASELLTEESSERWYMDGSLLDTSILAEVGVVYCLTDDAVLLFDCVEEVLLKIRDNFFDIAPWVAFLKHNVRPAPVGTKLVQEVVKCIDSLVSNEFPNTLDQVVMKDLEKSGLWMDLRCDTEGVVIEVWDGLLDDLLEEMVFDLWL